MIRIAIVDDEPKCIDQMGKITEQFFSSMKKHFGIEKYLFSGELLVDIEEGQNFDIYLIDIEMPTVNGWDLARAIREKRDEPFIIFVTCHPEYSILGYEYNAWRYITKDTLEEKLPPALESIARRLDCRDRKYYKINTPSRSFLVAYNDIYYLRKEGKYTVMHTKEGIVKIRKAIHKIYDELGDQEFLFVDRGRVVNLRHIVAFSAKKITMRDGLEMIVCDTKYHRVKREFNDFWINKK